MKKMSSLLFCLSMLVAFGNDAYANPDKKYQLVVEKDTVEGKAILTPLSPVDGDYQPLKTFQLSGENIETKGEEKTNFFVKPPVFPEVILLF